MNAKKDQSILQTSVVAYSVMIMRMAFVSGFPDPVNVIFEQQLQNKTTKVYAIVLEPKYRALCRILLTIGYH
jgi:hypothetical protein